MNDKYVFLYEAIKLVKSKSTYFIYDLQYKKMYNIDEVSAYILTYCKNNSINKMLDASKIERNIFFSSIDKLIKKNIIGYSNHCFNNNNIVNINCSNSITFNFIKVIELEYNKDLIDWLKYFINLISDNIWIDSILINLNNSTKLKLFLNFLSKKRIGSIIINDCANILSKDEIAHFLNTRKASYILVNNDCELKNCLKRTKYPKFFMDFNLFYESLSYNTYYNNRIYIDFKGNIKPGKNITKDFAHLSSIIDYKNFKALFDINDFNKYKNIKKEYIFECNKCIYRHMCIDDREPIKSGEADFYYFDKRCDFVRTF